GSAYVAGFRQGLQQGYDLVLTMDCDFSHHPRYLPQILACARDHDLVIGSRYVSGGSIPQWGPARRALSRWGNRYTEAMLGLGVTDATSGFRAYRAPVLRRIDLQTVSAEGYAFQVEMAHRVVRAGGRVAEVPIEFLERVRGSSKMSARIVVEALILVTWWGLGDRVRGLRPGVPIAHPDEQVVRRLYAARADGRLDDVERLLAGDVEWHQPGPPSAWTGELKGAAAVVAMMSQAAGASGGTLRIALHDVVANGDHTVALADWTAERDGRALAGREVAVFHLQDGAVTSASVFGDPPSAFEGLWAGS
ncbi:MAG: nuclear transport factor 2 family protein, partial [Acidimicrobiales bacterium]